MAETTFSWILRTLFLFSVLFQCSKGQKDLQITNVTSPTSAQLVVSWNSSSTLVAYFMLDLRVANNSSIAAITAIASTTSRSKLMQGLRTGTYYNVTLKSYGSSGALLATTSVQAQTVTATPEIATANGISSSEITVGWSSVVGVDFYFLMVSLGKDSINRTYKALNCSIGDLKPSSLYSLTLYGVNSAGSSAASKRITVLTLTPPPTNVSVTTISSYAVTLTWSSVDYALMYGIFVYEVGLSPSLAYIRKTTSLVITLDNLLPCTHYMFALTSYNWFYTAGQENQVLYETGKVASPQILNIQYNSNLGNALISWTSSLGASSYMVTAKSDTNYESLCTSTSNSCEIQGLVCEQRYTVSIVALTNNCTSNTSEALILETAPCAPKNVTIIRDCSINTVNVYWNPVIGAVRYISNAFAPDGSKEECANQDTYCFFMNLLCGTEYEISVLAFNGKINSSGSPRIKIRTAPCEPRNVQAIIQCQDNSLDVSWNPSNGASFYTASVLGSSGVTYNCSSVNTSCQIVGLECGESLSLSVIAYDFDCPSMSSHPEDIVTVPCAPNDVLALTDCDTKSIFIRWSYSEGAVMYIAKAVATDGSEHSCESFELSCTLSELPCSQTYMVSVTASNYQCISPQSPSSEFNTVPCIPKNIGANLNCDQNTIHVTWSEDNGNVTFKATAKSDSSFYNCTSQERYCEITNVACGQLYTVSVDAEKGQCLASSNETASLYSVPCKPTDISAQSVCANDSTVISWTKSLGVGTEMYIAAMQTQDGQNLMCHSTTNQCVLGGIKCGKIYNASVIAVSSDCQSSSSELYVDPGKFVKD
ncbi:fibronectin type III domain-containing protein 7-like [Rana temporaria]|uniref:fibronectin type III domain-containing protein 7-like n=1 Tax=Rana temporaria TaxID=8407 RepID=UPI001AACAF27|nr:fibronectin type III domain-containing protein 7-like [Rana temporaria]